MRTLYLTSVAVIALACGVSAAGAQNADQRPQVPNQQQGAQQQGAQQQTPVTTGQSQPQAGEPRQGENQRPDAQRERREPQQGAPNPQEQQAGGDEAHAAGLVAVDERDQMRISEIIRRQRIQPVTNLNVPLSVAASVPSSVRLSRMSGELADIFPNYRDFSFFVTKQELVIVDPESHAMVGFVPISAGAVAAAPARENSATQGAAEPPRPAQEPPPPAQKKAVRTQKKRVTVTQEKSPAPDRETLSEGPARSDADPNVGTSRRSARTEPGVTARTSRRPARTETDVTVGTSRRPPRPETDVTVGTSPRDSDEVYEVAPRNRGMPPPPVRRGYEHDEVPFPFSLFFGRWN
jgi:hypothetical protein